MKHCGYCGKDEHDNSSVCGGCGTSFPVDDPTESGGQSAVRTPLGLSLVTASGILLISGALFFALGRAAAELGLVPGKPPAGQRAIYHFLTSLSPAPFIVVAAILPTFRLCQVRLAGRFLPFATAWIIVFALAAVALLPRLVPGLVALWCLPATVFGNGGTSSTGCYAGAALQSAAGISLLIWSRTREHK